MAQLDYSLYLIADPTLCLSESDFLDRIRDSVLGGVTLVQLRDKSADLQRARLVRELTLELDVPLVVNDFPEIAIEVRADGLHVGQEDMSVKEAREELGPDLTIGLSVETQEQLKAARDQPVNYIGISSIFPSSTKRVDAPPWGLEGMRMARRISTIPMVAIGGLHEGNCAAVLQAGSDGIALASAILYHPSPQKAAEALREIIDRERL